MYHTYPTGSDSVPDGIDFVGDPIFDAVFYDGGLNSGPNIVTDVGLPSSFGTFGQGGNVYEWDETAFDRANNSAGEGRAVLGGSWKTASTDLLAQQTGIGILPSQDGDSIGIRIANVVPEPFSCILMVVGVVVLINLARFRPSSQP